MAFYKLIPSQISKISPPADPYFREAWAFCVAWAEGQESFVLHTSGSTGTPKPICLTRAQMQASAAMTQQAIGLQKGQTALVCLNTAYIAGTMMLVRGMVIGLTMYVVPPSANPFEHLPTEISVDFAAFVPLQLQTALDLSLHARLNALRTIIVGGAPVHRGLLSQIQALSVSVYSTFGMTETVSHVALQRLNGAEASETYQLLPRIEASTDERGCLRVRGPVTAQEWVQTNDLIEWIDSQHFRITGRADNIINSGGVKIQLEKVEEAIGRIWGDWGRFFVWWQPDDTLGQKLVLVVENAPNLDFENVKKQLKTTLSSYEIPKKIYSVEKFAETPTGKIDKHATFVRIVNQINP
ncbi:MAG: AMP-binding protein [Spirosomaceae bacterium]|jgi:O-succinylbenzoic acid--CoA ligase|nr:AMP-binding protein [Spirosomataceae bacterium]